MASHCFDTSAFIECWSGRYRRTDLSSGDDTLDLRPQPGEGCAPLSAGPALDEGARVKAVRRHLLRPRSQPDLLLDLLDALHRHVEVVGGLRSADRPAVVGVESEFDVGAPEVAHLQAVVGHAASRRSSASRETALSCITSMSSAIT